MDTISKRVFTNKSLALLFASTFIATLFIITSLYGKTYVRNRLLRQQSRDEKFNSPYRFVAEMENPRVLNVHVVPHTHDDVGWLKTVDEYFYGLNTSIVDVCVKDILDTVIQALLENPSRTFTYVEQKFFSMWWELQDDSMRDSVRFLVSNQQLNFVNGGWCMHDEAATHYMGMIDQTTLGHDFLKRELGVIPKVGWQLDPFGHSSSQSSLLTSKVGFDALYFGRIDYQDLHKRQLEKDCEGLWNASRSSNDSTVFWGLTGSYKGNYGAPEWAFCYDEVRCKDVPKPTEMNMTQLVVHVEDFLRDIRLQSNRSRGNHLMVTMGEDFNYMRAGANFANLDTLINAIQNFQDWGIIDVPALFSPEYDYIKIFYSSPEYYTNCKHEELEKSKRKRIRNSLPTKDTVKYTVKMDDFFPYADREHGFWTGYFTSRAGLKRLERVASSFLLATRQIDSLRLDDNTTRSKKLHHDYTSALNELEDAVSIVQHHDGVSGTSMQHVAYDYAKRLQSGIDHVSSVTATKLRHLFFGTNMTPTILQDLSLCQRINETVCRVSQEATMEANTTDIYIIVYNPLGWSQKRVVHLPVSSCGTYHILKIGQQTKDAVLAKAVTSLNTVAKDSARFVLSFQTGHLPPLGASVFQIKFVEKQVRKPRIKYPKETVADHRLLQEKKDKNDVILSNGLIHVVLDGTSGALKNIKCGNLTLNATHEWGYYTSFDNEIDKSDDDQNSGAYVFRPSIPEQKPKMITPVTARFDMSPSSMEAHVSYEEDWIQTTFRVMPDNPYLEIEYTIGPIPINDGRGKDVISRISTPIESSSTFYTDSNGREFIKRKKNYRPTWDLNVFEPVAGNFYPVNAAIYIEDDSRKDALAIATDRSVGGSSLTDGSIELMVHRRTLADDNRGVREPMNETQIGITPYPPYGNVTRLGEGIVVRGKHKILIGENGGASLARSVMDSSFAELFVFVGSSNVSEDGALPFLVSNFTGVGQSLPKNVMLITRKRLPRRDSLFPSQFLIRLGHQYGPDEDSELSGVTHVDIQNCLPGYNISGIEEMTLSGNQNYDIWLKNRLNWTQDDKSYKGNRITGSTIELNPMEIRTFHVSVQ